MLHSLVSPPRPSPTRKKSVFYQSSSSSRPNYPTGPEDAFLNTGSPSHSHAERRRSRYAKTSTGSSHSFSFDSAIVLNHPDSQARNQRKASATAKLLLSRALRLDGLNSHDVSRATDSNAPLGRGLLNGNARSSVCLLRPSGNALEGITLAT